MRANREALIRAVKTYAAGVKGRMSFLQFCRKAGVREAEVLRHFPEGFRELMAAAGLSGRVSGRGWVHFDQLMEEYERVARLLGRGPNSQEIRRMCRVGYQTFYNRIGPMEKVRAEYERWRKRRAQRGGEPERAAAGPLWREGPRPGLVGRPLCLPGLVHAPTMETAVVYLFGVLAERLGYVVEQFEAGYPDCRVLRAVEGPGERWRRLAVEFELKSSNFKAHGHDPARCDLIVCWEHDWKDCPVEVEELKSVVGKMVARGREAA